MCMTYQKASIETLEKNISFLKMLMIDIGNMYLKKNGFCLQIEQFYEEKNVLTLLAGLLNFEVGWHEKYTTQKKK